MKILIIHCAYQYKGGEDTVVEEEMKLLQNTGAETALLHFSNDGETGLKVLQLPFNIGAYRKARKAIKRFAPDIVHIHNLHFAASPSVIYAVKHSGVPFVCTLHNYRLLCPSAILFHKGEAFLDSLEQTFPWTAVKKGVYKNSRLLTFWMAFSMQVHHWLGTWRLPNRFIVLSKHARQIFLDSKLRLQRGQVVVKPNFCSVPALVPEERGKEFLFVGRLSAEKGIPLLLDIFSSSTHKIIIAGNGPLKDEVMAASKKFPNIVYAGTLQKAELMQLMQRCSALVFPSIWYEGMPLTIIEAFACGLPVLATKLGAMEYMVTPGHDGLLFEAGSKTGLRKALDEWTLIPAAQKEKFSANAQHTYREFYTPEKNAEQLLHIYQSVLGKEQPVAVAFAG